MSNYTALVHGQIGPRAWAFAFKVASSMQYLGDTLRQHRIVFLKPRHAREFGKLQERDRKEGLCRE